MPEMDEKTRERVSRLISHEREGLWITPTGLPFQGELDHVMKFWRDHGATPLSVLEFHHVPDASLVPPLQELLATKRKESGWVGEDIPLFHLNELIDKGPASSAQETEPAQKPEAVAHPAHYGGASNPYEAIKVIEAWELDFCLGNTVKYISRAGKKQAGKEIEDLEKAAWYLARRIQQLKASSGQEEGA